MARSKSKSQRHSQSRPEYPTISKRKRLPQGQSIAKDNRESRERIAKLSYKARLAAYAKEHRMTQAQAAVALMLEDEKNQTKKNC